MTRLLRLATAALSLAATSIPIGLLAQPVITATKSDGIPGTTRVTAGSTITYTHVIGNSGNAQANGVQFADPDIAGTTLVAGSLRTSCVAFPDSYACLGNVPITIPALTGILANDIDPDNVGPALTAALVSGPTQTGSSLVLNPDGSFTYTPPPGYEGADTFVYRLNDNEGNTDTATVTINISGMIWFVDASVATGGDGRLTSPFKTLAAFSALNDGTGNRPAPNDTIFIYENAADYTGGVTLLSGQRLIGQDASQNLATLANVTVPTGSAALPAMNSGNAVTTKIANATTGAGITLNANSRIHGFTAGNATTNASINGTVSGTIYVSDVAINTPGAGLNLTGGTFANGSAFTSITSTGGASGIVLTNAGTGDSLNLGTGALSGHTQNSFAISGGTGTFNYSGTIAKTTVSSSAAVAISNKTSGVVNLSGSVTATNTPGVALTSNTGATINFTGGLSISSAGNIGFNATGGGTVSAAQNNSTIVNTITSTSGIALNVVSTNIGAAGLTFRSISSSGPAPSGIVVDSTGSAGSLTVTGNGTTDSGGIIASSTQSGVILTSTASPNFNRIRVSNTAGEGMRLANISGSFTLNNSTLNGNALNNLWLDNFNTPLTSLNLTNTVFSSAGNSGALVEMRGTSILGAATFNGNTIENNTAIGLQVTSADTATITAFTASANTFRDTGTGNSQEIGVDFSKNQISNLTAIVTGNTFLGHSSHPLNFFAGPAGTTGGTYSAKIQGNTIGNNSVAGSGSVLGNGIRVNMNGLSANRILIDGNQVYETPNGRGIEVIARAGAGATDATIINNVVDHTNVGFAPGGGAAFPLAGIFAQSNTLSTLRADIRLNTVTGPSPSSDVLNTYIQINETGTSTATLLDTAPASPNATEQLVSNNNGTASANAGVALTSTPLNIPALLFTPEAAPAKAATAPESARLEVASKIESPAEIPAIVAEKAAPDVSQAQLDAIVAAARARWISSGLSDLQLTALENVGFELADLPGWYLGEATSKIIRIDRDAGGNGWSVSDEVDADRVDLLTTILHEMGHTVGLHDTYSNEARHSVMHGFLSKGERRLPRAGEAVGAVPHAHHEPHFLAAPIALGNLPAGKSITVTYQVTVNTPVAVNSISSQATVSGSNFANVSTDDPDVAGAANPTVTLLGAPPTFTNANAATFLVGSANSFQFTASGVPASTFTTASTLPANVTLSSAGVLAGNPAAGSGGTYTLTINSANGVSPDATQTFTLTVNEVPRFTSAASTAFVVGTAKSYPITTASFPAGATVSSSGTLPAGLTLTAGPNGTATISGTPEAGSGGVYNIALSANNGLATNGSQTLVLTVNEPPAFTSSTTATLVAGTAGSFTITTAPGFPLNPTITRTGALPASLTFTNNGNGTATISGTPTIAQIGDYSLTLTANNGTAPNATQNLLVKVIAPNSAPTISDIPNTTLTNAASQAVSFTIGDSETAASLLTVSGVSGNQSLVPNANIVFSGTGANRTATITPITATGSTTITITVADPEGLTTSDSFTFNWTRTPTLATALLATDLSTTTGTNVAIGELVTFQTSVTVYEGTTAAFIVRTNLPAGLAYVPGSASLVTSGFNGTVTLASVTTSPFISGSDATFNLGAVNAATDNVSGNNTFSITYQAVVLDVAGNEGILPGQTTLATTTSLDIGGGFVGTTAPVNLTVVEPLLTPQFSMSPNTGDAADTITVVMSVAQDQNSTMAGLGVTLEAAVPADYIYVPGSISPGSGLSPTTISTDTNSGPLTVRAVWDSFPLASAGSVQFQVRLANTVTPRQSIQLSIAFRYNTRPSNSGPAFDPSSDVTTDRGRLTTTSGTADLTVPAASVTYTLDSTNAASTTGTAVTFGELLTYKATVTLPEGTTPGLTLLQILPPGLTYVTSSVSSVGFNGTIPAPSITGGTGDGSDLTATFASITTTGDNVTTNNSFSVLLTARVTNSAAISNNSTLATQLSSDVAGDGIPAAISADVTVSVVEPVLAVTQNITETSAFAGDRITFNLTAENTGGSAGYENSVRIPLSISNFDLSSVDFGTAGTNYPVGYTPTANTTSGVVEFAGGTINAAAVQNFSFTVRLAANLARGTVVTTAPAIGQPTTLPGTNTGERSQLFTSGTDTISILNPAPTDIILTNNTIAENNAANATIGTLSATDDATDTNTFALVSGIGSTDNASFNLSGATLRINQAADFETKPTYLIRIRATDSGGGFVEKAFTISVTNANDAPVLSAILPQSGNEDAAIPAIDFTVSDQDAADTISLSGTSSNTALVSNGSIVFGGTGSNRTVTLTPAANAFGTTTITITAYDGTTSTPTSFVLTVNPVNDAPTLADISNPAALTINSGAQTVNLTGITTGAANETQALTVAATSNNTTLIPNPTVSYTSPNSTAVLNFTPALNQSGSATITVTVRDNGGTTNGGIDAVQKTFVVNVTPNADLAVSVIDLVNTAIPGGNITYRIMASNTGPNSVTGAVLQAAFPASLTASWTGSGMNGASGPASGSGNLSESLNLPAGSTFTFVITAQVSPAATGSVVTSATIVSPVGYDDPTPANNSASDTNTLTPQADLGIMLTDGATTSVPGENLSYQITVTNNGPSNVSGATVTDAFPTALTATWTATGINGATGPASGSGDISASVNLPAGSSYVFTVNAGISPSASGSISNTATVTAPTGVTDLVPENNSATDTNTLTPSGDLAISITDEVTTATPGTSTTYKIVVSNSGPSNIAGATVADVFPASLTANWTAIGTGGATGPASGSGNINATVSLPKNSTYTFTVIAGIAPGATGTLSNTATISSSSDSNSANNSATDTNTLTPSADVSVAVVDSVDPVNAGSEVTYTITVTNAGPSNATSVSLANQVPAGTSLTAVTVPAGWTGTVPALLTADPLNVSVANLPVGSAVFTMRVKVPFLANNTELTDSATISSTTADPLAINNSDSEVTTVSAIPEITVFNGALETDVEISDGDLTAINFGSTTANNPITRTFLVKNSGTGPLIISSVTLPSGFSFATPFAPQTIAPTASAALAVRYDAPSVGTSSGSIVINSNDTSEAAFDFPITGTRTNVAPVAVAQTVALDEDTPKPITLTGTDVDGNSLTYTVTIPPVHGVLSGTAPNLTYTPATNYNGPDSFSFKVNDGAVDSAVAIITLDVRPVNDRPVATPRSVTLNEDTPTAITLAGTDIENSPLTFTVTQPPQHGVLSGTAPNLTYTPAANYNGADSFIFKVNDGELDSALQAIVTIQVDAVNDAPIAIARTLVTDEDVPLPITLTGSDIDLDPLTFTVLARPTSGSLTGTAPNLTYVPNPNFNGTDSFTFKVNDGTVDSAVARIDITVNAVNDDPVVIGTGIPDVVLTRPNVSTTINLANYFRDEETASGSLTYSVGLVSLTETMFAPPAGVSLNGTQLTISGFMPGIVEVTITAKDPSNAQTSDVFRLITKAIPEIAGGGIPATNLPPSSSVDINLATYFIDRDADPLSYAVTANTATDKVGTTINGPTLTLDPLGSGTASITIRATDSDANFVEQTFTVTVADPVPTLQPTPGFTPTINRQTGLYEVSVTATNLNRFDVPGFRFRASNLPAGITLRNSTGPAGQYAPYLDVLKTTIPGESVVVVLEFYSATRNYDGFNPTITVEPLPDGISDGGTGAGMAVTLLKPQADGSILLEFTSIVGKFYQIEYSSDLVVWKKSLVPIKAGGNRVQWIDRGSPYTDAHPSTVPQRFYRVSQID